MALFDKMDLYKEALNASWLFYEAQISGKKPQWSRIPWRGDAHVDDAVPGGWYDAGDFLKISFPLATSVVLLNTSLLDFPEGYRCVDAEEQALHNLRWALQYLLDCHTEPFAYVGLIGDVGKDHSYWGRPEDQHLERPVTIWKEGMPAADLLGAISAALASGSILFERKDPAFSSDLLTHAIHMYEWAKRCPAGVHVDSCPRVKQTYPSSRCLDKLMLAASWLCRATGEKAYAEEAFSFWQKDGSVPSVYVGWDSLYAAAVNLLLKLHSQGWPIPGHAAYEEWWRQTFMPVWLQADGNWSIVRTPKGLIYPSWSRWGNLRYACNVAFMMALRAQYTSDAEEKANVLAWARSQLDYALGSTGRSFVIGIGNNPPVCPHHRAASTPYSTDNGWQFFESQGPNPHCLTGALVGGPPAGDESYVDNRKDYESNEVAVDYNAGFTGALAGVLTLS